MGVGECTWGDPEMQPAVRPADLWTTFRVPDRVE
jgi:hypothetical protein